MSKESLWPELQLEATKTPRSLLIEQAQFLSTATKNVLKGYIERIDNSKKEELTFKFLIVAPALNDFNYDLFTIRYNLVKMYPVIVKRGTKPVTCKTEQELKARLRLIFKDEKTMNLVKSLFAQSVEE